MSIAAAAITAGCALSSPAPTGTKAEASSAAAAQYASNTPPAAAKMICDQEIRGKIADALALASDPVPQPAWSDHVYTCTYALPMGRLIMSVKVSPSDDAARQQLSTMKAAMPNPGFEPGLGQEGYSTDLGTLVAVKDNMVLRVDATALPDDLGTVHEKRTDFARVIAAGVFSCWTGNT